MKKIIVTLAVGCLLAIGAKAQLAVVAGADFSDFKLSDAKNIGTKLKTATGYTFGLTYDIKLPLGLGVNTGLQFIQRNVKQDGGGSNSFDRFSSLEIPLNLKYRFDLPVVKPFLVGGPYLDYGLWAKQGGQKVKYGDGNDRVTWGLALGAGVDLFNTLRVMYQYDWGLTDLSVGDVVDAVKTKARGNRVTVGILF